jgi:hypothetical protein
LLVLIYTSLSGAGTTSVLGGAAGAGGGTGGFAGGAGSTGTVLTYQIQ